MRDSSQTMSKKKETKNSIVYANSSSDWCKGIYVQRDLFPDGNIPEYIVVSVASAAKRPPSGPITA